MPVFPPFEGSNGGIITVDNFNPALSYSINNLVVFDDIVYRNIDGSSGAFNVEDWFRIAEITNGIIFPDESTQQTGALPNDFNGFTSLASFNQFKSIEAQTNNPTGIFFKPDLKLMFITDNQQNKVIAYELSIAGDVSTAVPNGQEHLTGEIKNTGLWFSPDGLKFYHCDTEVDDVDEFTMAIPWDITSTTGKKELDLSFFDTEPRSVVLNPEGTIMLILGNSTDTIYEFRFSEPFNLDTATFNSKTLDVSSLDTQVRGLYVSEDGKKMYIYGNATKTIYMLELPVPWDVTSANVTQADSLDIVNDSDDTRDLWINSGLSKMYLATDPVDSEVTQYDIPIKTVVPIGANTFYINSESDLKAIFPDNIITSNATIFFNKSMTFEDGIVINPDVTVEFIAEVNQILITYTGAGTLFSTIGGAQGLVTNAANQIKVTNLDFNGDNTATLFDVRLDVSSVLFEDNFNNFLSLGQVRGIAHFWRQSSFVNYFQGILFLNSFLVDIKTLIFQQTSVTQRVTAIKIFNQPSSQTFAVLKTFDITLQDLSGNSDSVFFLDINAPSGSQFLISDTIAIPSNVKLFSKNVETLPIRTVDSVSGTPPTSPSTFTTSIAHGFSNGDIVLMDAFTNPAYNGSFIISGVSPLTPTKFNTDAIFGITDSGTARLEPETNVLTTIADGTGFTKCSTFFAHGLRVGDIVVLTNFSVTEYNGTFVVTAVDTPLLGTTFTIQVQENGDTNGIFVITSIDSTDSRVLAKDNIGFKDSMTQIEGNSTKTLFTNLTTPAFDTFVNLDNNLSGVLPDDFAQDILTERFTLDTSTGKITVTALQPTTMLIDYLIQIQRVDGGANARDYVLSLFVNDVESTKFTRLLTNLTTAPPATIAFKGLLEVNPADIISIQIKQTDTTGNDRRNVSTSFYVILHTRA